MISAVLFDLDGTLVETEELKALSHARSVTELRPDIAEADVIAAYADDLVGHSCQEVATTLMQRFWLEEAARERMSISGRRSRGGYSCGSVTASTRRSSKTPNCYLNSATRTTSTCCARCAAKATPQRAPPYPTGPRWSVCSPCSDSKIRSM